MTDSPFPGVRLPAELFQRFDLTKALAFEPPKIVHPAEAMFHQLAKQIAEFEEQLDDTEEVGARLVSGPNNTTFHITGLEYKGRELIVFHGLNEHGKTIRLLQHVAQINVLLTALPKQAEKPRRMGFIWQKDAEE